MRFLPVVVLLAACATAPSPAPSMASAAEDGWIAVSGTRPEIAVGEWKTAKAREGELRSILMDAGVVGYGARESAQRFSLNDLDVECHTQNLAVGRGGFFIGPEANETAVLTCGFLRGANGPGGGLLLIRTGRAEPAFRGELRVIDGRRMELRSVHMRLGTLERPSEAFGYEIVHNDTVVARIQNLDGGRVWIEPNAKDRDFLAAAAASLLLFPQNASQ